VRHGCLIGTYRKRALAVRAPINIAATLSETGAGGEKAGARPGADVSGVDPRPPEACALAIRRIGGRAGRVAPSRTNASRPA